MKTKDQKKSQNCDCPSDISKCFLWETAGIDPIKILKRKIYATLFLSILIGWKMAAANQNAWKNSVA